MNIGDKKWTFSGGTKMNKSDHFDPQKSLEKDVTSKNTKSALFYLQM